MQIFSQPMSQDEKRLRLRLVMKLLMEGEDIDYIRMKIRANFPANLSAREIKDVALNVAILSPSERDSLVQDIGPIRFDDRHFHEALREADQKAQNRKSNQLRRDAKLEQAGAAMQASRVKWKRRFETLKLWVTVMFWVSVALFIIYTAAQSS